MALGATAVSQLAAQLIGNATIGSTADIVAPWFSASDAVAAQQTLGRLGSMFGLSSGQMALIIGALAYSPSASWYNAAVTSAQRLKALNNLAVAMISSAVAKPSTAGAAQPNAATNLIVWSADSGNTIAVQGGDLVAWLGGAVT
jgi:hypothetical protein